MVELSCRVCLIPNVHASYNIFTSTCKKHKVLLCDMFLACTKIKPQFNDGHPKQICKNCNRQLKRAYTFSLLCTNSENRLKKLLDKSTEKDVNSTEESKCDIKIEERVQTREVEVKNEDNIKLEPHIDNSYIENDEVWEDEDEVLLGFIKHTKNNELKMENEENDEPSEDINVKVKKRGRKKNNDGVQDGKLLHQCDTCGKLLSSKGNLKAHKICHTDLRPYTCTDCPATFRGYSALFQHRKIHNGNTPYHCEYCPRQFSRRTSLINHIRIHTGEKLYYCEICHKTFTQSAQLSIHLKRHKGEKSFLCQDCGKGFPIKSDLRVHQRIHNGEKPYSCNICPKTFSTSGNLSIHIRIHNKEVRYNCKDCSRGFITHSSYSIHMKRHKGQKDYRCDCGKCFYTSSALKQHKVVHTGEKRYQCKICDRKFTQTSHLTRHFRKDHGKPNGPNISSDQYKLIIPSQPAKIVNKIEEIHELKDIRSSRVKCEST